MSYITERARESLDKIGEGDWTPQDVLFEFVVEALEEAEREKEGLHRENAWLRETLTKNDKAYRAALQRGPGPPRLR